MERTIWPWLNYCRKHTAHYKVRRDLRNWNLEVLVFGERGKPEYPEKNLSEQGREATTDSTHI